MTNRLHDYEARRVFPRSPEPRPGDGAIDRNGSTLFVIQEHDARRHHFDLRLEIDGVLVSWVVPRGPATDPQERRLALRMEDHPLAYADFEGVIPDGEYGAGQVAIWDRGSFENLTARDGEPVAAGRALDDGHLEVHLAGEKLHGGYTLHRTETGDDGERWLLVKMKDDEPH